MNEIKKDKQKEYMKAFVAKNKQTKKYCKTCDKDISYFVFSRHCKTARHTKNKAKQGKTGQRSKPLNNCLFTKII